MTCRTESATYRYGFNGKEQDSPGIGGGGSTYDYGFRIYNPEIGKFLSVDPLAASYPFYTPYQFAGNTPIRALDLDGLEILDYRANFRLNYSKSILGTVYFADVYSQLQASSSTGIELKSRTIKTEKNDLHEGQFNLKESPAIGSTISASPSIWNDDRPDASPADRTASKIQKYNRNSAPTKWDSRAAAIQYLSKFFYNDILNGDRNRVLSEIDQQIQSLRLSYGLVENALNNTDEQVLNDNYEVFNVSEELFKVDLVNYVFDGTLPKDKKGYGEFIKNQGDNLLDRSRNILQNKKRIVE